MTLPGIAAAQGTTGGAASSSSALEEVIVTGYRRSLEDAATAKKDSTNFTDSVFAEDIGKFPDLNIAEALQRIPGIQLTREINGDGLNIAIRGLGTDFTKVTLNGAQIAVASTGRTDAQGSNRELDLDLFPTELFTRLDVNKTPRADLIEGGVAGTVNMRSARPFDNPGTKISYQLQGGYGQESGEVSPRGAVTASWTNDTFGVLFGAAGVHNRSTTQGFETIGWSNMLVSNSICGTAGAPLAVPTVLSCNSTGGNSSGWSPGRVNTANTGREVPAGAGGGLAEGTVLNRQFFESHNPGLSLEQISNALIPRLGRPSYSSGTRDRYSGILSLEYRPLDSLHLYLDSMYAKAKRSYDRIDMNFVGRSGASIPLNLQLDENGVVRKGDFANAQFFLEARPYDEDVDFYNLNPGAHYQVLDWLGVDLALNKTRSTFFRESPTVLINTPLARGNVVTIDNTSGDIPSFTSNSFDLNDPNLGWTWAGGRVNLQAERRVTKTEGAHLDVKVGSDDLNLQVGGAWDDISRSIVALDNTRAWQQQVCGGGGAFIDQPLPQPPCNGQAGSSIPQGALASYITRGPGGFITIDLDRFKADSNYAALLAAAPVAQAANTSAPSGFIEEKNKGGYLEGNLRHEIGGHLLRVNAGARYVTTDQIIRGPFIIGGVVQQGPFQELLSDYSKVLPSFNAAYNLAESVVLRAGASRTLTRPNPSFMLPATTVTDVTASAARQGNPDLQPYISDNIDLGGEWYTGREGFVGVNLFRKKIANFTTNGVRTTVFSELGIPLTALTQNQRDAVISRGGPDVSPIDIQQQVNSTGKLRIQGYEVTWVQPLGQFAPVLDGFGFNANYTRVTQKALGQGVPTFAQGVSPTTYNGTVYYERGPASVRLSYTWSDAQIQSDFNEQGIPLARRFSDAYKQLDMSASYEFKNLPTSPMVTLNVINITSEKQRSTFQFDSATFTEYNPGYQILLGIRGKF